MFPACLIPPRADPKKAKVGKGKWSWDASWVTAPAIHKRLGLVGAVPPLCPDEAGATAVQWAEWWEQTRMVPPEAWRQLLRVPINTTLTSRQPLTTIEHLARYKGVHVGKYPDGRDFTFDDLPGLSGVGLSFRLDKLDESGSVALIPHEVAHSLNLFVWGRLDATPEWINVHRSSGWPDAYTTRYPDEALCEAFAFKCAGLIHYLPQRVETYMDKLWAGQRYDSWPPGY